MINGYRLEDIKKYSMRKIQLLVDAADDRYKRQLADLVIAVRYSQAATDEGTKALEKYLADLRGEHKWRI